MLKVNFAEIKRKELATAKLKKMTLDAVHAHQLFDAKSMSNLTHGLNEETRSQLLRLDESGPLRRLMIVPDDYLAKCRELEDRFPNFSGYINDYLLPSLALAHVRKASLQLQPTVFVGSPGVGKTLFVSALAEMFYLDFERVNLETAQASIFAMLFRKFDALAEGFAFVERGVCPEFRDFSEYIFGLFDIDIFD